MKCYLSPYLRTYSTTQQQEEKQALIYCAVPIKAQTNFTIISLLHTQTNEKVYTHKLQKHTYIQQKSINP